MKFISQTFELLSNTERTRMEYYVRVEWDSSETLGCELSFEMNKREAVKGNIPV